MLQTIRARLVALVLAVALPLFGVLAWAFWAEIARVHNSARDLALRIAVSIASDVRSSNRHSRGVLQQMAQRLKTQNSGPGGCDAYFGIIDFYPQYLNLVLLDATGNLICSSTPAPADAPYTAAADPQIREHVRQTRGRNFETVVIPAKDKWILVRFQPVVSDRVLALEEDLALSVDAFPTGTVVTLVDGHGTILARSSDGERWIGYNIRSTGLDVLAQQGQKGRAEARGVDGVLRQYGFTRIDGSDWALYVGIPAGIARSAVRDTISRGAAAGIIICLVVMLIALQQATTIKRPLDGLARAAQ